MKNQSIKSRWISAALALIASFVAVLSSSGTQVARSQGGESEDSYDIMFTKWVTCYSDQKECEDSDGAMVVGTMSGLITGGDAGTGSFSGRILDVIQSTPELWEAVTVYQIHGAPHGFSAHMLVMENPETGEGTLVGKIVDGWLKGRLVQGSYNTISSCPENPIQPPDPSSPCYVVTLHIHAGD